MKIPENFQMQNVGTLTSNWNSSKMADADQNQTTSDHFYAPSFGPTLSLVLFSLSQNLPWEQFPLRELIHWALM